VHEFWLDETFSFHDATAVHWLADLPTRDMPPLLHHAAALLVGVVARRQGGAALLSAILGTLAVAATMWAAREIAVRGRPCPAASSRARADAGAILAGGAADRARAVLIAPTLGSFTAPSSGPDARLGAASPSSRRSCCTRTIFGRSWCSGTAGMLLVAPSGRVLRALDRRRSASPGCCSCRGSSRASCSSSTPLAGIDWIADAWVDDAAARRQSRGTLELFVLGPRAGWSRSR
jgi:hypothetical protein